MSSTDPTYVPDESSRPRCFLCGRPTFDPDKRQRQWVRAAVGGEQVLVCPTCQEDRPDWAVQLDRCDACGASRPSQNGVPLMASARYRGFPPEKKTMLASATWDASSSRIASDRSRSGTIPAGTPMAS